MPYLLSQSEEPARGDLDAGGSTRIASCAETPPIAVPSAKLRPAIGGRELYHSATGQDCKCPAKLNDSHVKIASRTSNDSSPCPAGNHRDDRRREVGTSRRIAFCG